MFEWIFRQSTKKKPVIIICGPTASGKSSAAITVARMLQDNDIESEIISADSRQIYRGIPIFSGAVSEEQMQTVTHHLVGTEDLTQEHSVSWFRAQALQLIGEMHSHNKVPIVAGGSAFWIQSLLFKDNYPEVVPNEELRQTLKLFSTQELYSRLQQLDPNRAQSIDPQNPRRLVRAIEIATQLGSVPPMKYVAQEQYDVYLIYISASKEVNNKKIEHNVVTRFEQGLIEEARKVRTLVSDDRMRELGLAYKYIHAYIDGNLTRDELIAKTILTEQQYAKRQRTFFNKIFSNTRALKKQFSHKDEIDSQEILRWVLKCN